MTLTSWKKPLRVTPRYPGDGLSTVLHKSAVGWRWRLLCSNEQVASGRSPTMREAVMELRAAKVAWLGRNKA